MKTDRLERLFELYSADLAKYLPKHGGRFGCPLCLAAIEPILPLEAVVAEEHVLPRALGGRTTTLTCRKCNNTSGTSLEAHLVQRVLIDARERKPRAIVRIGRTVVRADLDFPLDPAETATIAIVGKQSDPRQIAAQQKLLKPGMPDIHITANFGYVPRRSVVALMRAAYLLMFRYFGYRYIGDPSAVAIREQVRDWNRESPVLRGVLWRFDTDHVGERPIVAVLREPSDMAGFLVLLPLHDRPPHVSAVLLPPPGHDAEEFYARALSEPRAAEVKAVPLAEPRAFVPLSAVWEAVIGRRGAGGEAGTRESVVTGGETR